MRIILVHHRADVIATSCELPYRRVFAEIYNSLIYLSSADVALLQRTRMAARNRNIVVNYAIVIKPAIIYGRMEVGREVISYCTAAIIINDSVLLSSWQLRYERPRKIELLRRVVF